MLFEIYSGTSTIFVSPLDLTLKCSLFVTNPIIKRKITNKPRSLAFATHKMLSEKKKRKTSFAKMVHCRRRSVPSWFCESAAAAGIQLQQQ